MRAACLLDMCFEPRNTRGAENWGRLKGWTCVEGTEIIGQQIVTQWGLGTGEGGDVKGGLGRRRRGECLRRAVEESMMINF